MLPSSVLLGFCVREGKLWHVAHLLPGRLWGTTDTWPLFPGHHGLLICFLSLLCFPCSIAVASSIAGHSPRLAEGRAGREAVPHYPVPPSAAFWHWLQLWSSELLWQKIPQRGSASTAETPAWTPWDHTCLICQRGRILTPSLIIACFFPDVGP